TCRSAGTKNRYVVIRMVTVEGRCAGGGSVPVVVPGEPNKSILIQALRHQDKSLRMPPKEKLAEAILGDFEQWVRMGAPDPRAGGAVAARPEIDIDKGRQFWAFRPPRRHSPPAGRDTTWPPS